MWHTASPTLFCVAAITKILPKYWGTEYPLKLCLVCNCFPNEWKRVCRWQSTYQSFSTLISHLKMHFGRRKTCDAFFDNIFAIIHCAHWSVLIVLFCLPLIVSRNFWALQSLILLRLVLRTHAKYVRDVIILPLLQKVESEWGQGSSLFFI